MITTAGILTLVVSAAPALAAATIKDGAQVSGKKFDYVIAGGGLGGVVLASRLSEDASVSVLVIEAGYDEGQNPDVYDSGRYQKAFGSSIDWAYETVAQSAADGKPQTMRSGRALGGSTTINGMAWSKPHDYQLDALEALGNEGLNWATLRPYIHSVEKFNAPNETQIAAGVTFTSTCHGLSGLIETSIEGVPNQFEHDFNSSLQAIGLPWAGDNTCGNPVGGAPMAHNNFNGIRYDTYRAYLSKQNRPNLTILTGANVGKVFLSADATPRATGVEYRDEKGGTYNVNAGREVLLATGTIKTPVILQHSGIGPKSFLDGAGVQQRVELPVGQNLIDQATTTTNFVIDNAGGMGQPILFPRFQDLFSEGDAARLKDLLNTKLEAYAQEAVSAGAATNAAGLQKVLEIQRSWILEHGAGMSENYDYSYGTTLGYDSWFLLPFGRGSIKITSNDVYANSSFEIDPRFFANEFDALASGGTARYTRKVSTTQPLSNHVQGASDFPQDDNLESWVTWTKANYRSNWHPIATVPMMSKELGGCVDANHRVYGVEGLRVVDGSNLPFQVSSHLMSVLYGLAERAAVLIKAGGGGTTTPKPTDGPGSSTKPTDGPGSSTKPTHGPGSSTKPACRRST